MRLTSKTIKQEYDINNVQIKLLRDLEELLYLKAEILRELKELHNDK